MKVENYTGIQPGQLRDCEPGTPVWLAGPGGTPRLALVTDHVKHVDCREHELAVSRVHHGVVDVETGKVFFKPGDTRLLPEPRARVVIDQTAAANPDPETAS